MGLVLLLNMGNVQEDVMLINNLLVEFVFVLKDLKEVEEIVFLISNVVQIKYGQIHKINVYVMKNQH